MYIIIIIILFFIYLFIYWDRYLLLSYCTILKKWLFSSRQPRTKRIDWVIVHNMKIRLRRWQPLVKSGRTWIRISAREIRQKWCYRLVAEKKNRPACRWFQLLLQLKLQLSLLQLLPTVMNDWTSNEPCSSWSSIWIKIKIIFYNEKYIYLKKTCWMCWYFCAWDTGLQIIMFNFN